MANTFLHTITSEAEALKRFVDLLQLEQHALGIGKTEDLPGLAEQKNQLGTALNTLATERNALLGAQGFAADRSGVESWCAKHPHEKGVPKVWANILHLAAEARELNRLNGELIHIRMQYNSNALEALRGGSSSFDLYGPDGQSTTLGSRRINDAV